MSGSLPKLLADEAISHFGPRGDDLRSAGRDTSQRRGPVRPPAPRRVAGRTRDELSEGGQHLGGCAPYRGDLGSPVRADRVCGIERRIEGRPTVEIDLKESGPRRGGVAEQSGRLWTSSAALERPFAFGLSAKAVRSEDGCAQLPEAISPIRISAAQTPPDGGPSRPVIAGGGKKNSKYWPATPPSTFGRLMRSISSSTAAVAGCGSPRRSRNLGSSTHQTHTRASTLGSTFGRFMRSISSSTAAVAGCGSLRRSRIRLAARHPHERQAVTSGPSDSGTGSSVPPS